MAGRQFYWLAVFEQFVPVTVLQGKKDAVPDTFDFEEEPPAEIVQMVAQRWNRSGTVNISPGQTTEDVVKDIVTGCKGSGNIPKDALLTNIVLMPNRLAG